VTLNDSSGERRRQVTNELLDEMTAWKPRERIGAFRSWLRGSLSLVHLHVLSILESDGPIAMKRLAEALDVSVASATGIVDRMTERGLVQRHSLETDRRVVLVEATDTGRAVFADLAAGRREHLIALLDRLTDDELDAFLVGLRAIHRARTDLEGETPG
jgi:DNA-binding MarR family transcriptional regulator